MVFITTWAGCEGLYLEGSSLGSLHDPRLRLRSTLKFKSRKEAVSHFARSRNEVEITVSHHNLYQAKRQQVKKQ